MPHAVCQVQEAEASSCGRQQRPSPRIGCWSSARQSKPLDEAWDRVKVDQKDLDEHRNRWPFWRRSAATERQRSASLDRATRVDCWMQQDRQHEDEWKLNTDECANLHSRES